MAKVEKSGGDPKLGRKIAKAAMEWAETYDWKGKAGRTDKMCFLAHAKIAYKTNQVIYEFSAVYLAKLVNIPHGTVKDSNKRLREAGFIEMVEGICRQNAVATKWRITADGLGQESREGKHEE